MRERFNPEADAIEPIRAYRKDSTEHRIFLCENIVSRKHILDKFAECADNVRPYSDVWEYVKTMEPIFAIKVGNWINGVCSECGYDWGKDAPIASVPKYCPNCGLKMRKDG